MRQQLLNAAVMAREGRLGELQRQKLFEVLSCVVVVAPSTFILATFIQIIARRVGDDDTASDNAFWQRRATN